ncbi:DUF4382 domain-containing protein [Maribacter sp. MAR_2009_72]|uniref:DUF4382 domain-containing protein n=1 Tax=Maribacter sp. MAR_2009_72 TaxID=1250050 RepID=UPI00119AC61F|nr:DUF4382 domain-containing protein [Maribacter sp. MAR_2009_72]TVZ16417.1 uncharacterized protein DUF4382 [Maribacter sp. MAR_2009_72]
MKNYLKTVTVVFISTLMAVSCSNNDDGDVNMDAESYDTTFKITDAPIDNSNVEAVFVTVSNVKVDGTSLEGFNKTTFDLSALVNGETLTLGNLELEAGSYSNIELELDYETDADGNSPGCYVELVNGEKDQLEATASKISITDSFEVLATTTNEIIIDFDLRKTIKEEQGSANGNFEFVSMQELSSGIRTVNNDQAGNISGSANDAENTSDKIIVYAYENGTFNADVERNGQGESNVLFANAVTSSEVSGLNNGYNLSFLKEGEYELVFASYTQEGDGFAFNALLEVESTTGLDLGAISITSALQISANVTITGTK